VTSVARHLLNGIIFNPHKNTGKEILFQFPLQEMKDEKRRT
jgi:hypothetical protein